MKIMSRFDEHSLAPEVQKALAEMGYETMSPIQELALPKLLAGGDFLGQAPTGTGKTAAFGVPLVNRVPAGSDRIEALILGPTRELVRQISEELNRIGQFKSITILPIYGGENVFVQKELVREQKPQIVVGTPGRVLDLINQVVLDFSNTRLLVLDEADEMLDMGFRPDLEAIFKHLPMGRETWLFSATVSPEIRKIADAYMYYPEEIRIQPQTVSSRNIQQFYYVVPTDDKPKMLLDLLRSTEDLYGIVFCQTKRDVVQLTRRLRDKFPLDSLHGGMEQSDRNKVMEAFREKRLRLIVATDVMARGIDVDNLTHVINYDPPRDPESYIHRIGRTARMGEQGVAITLFTPREKRELEWLERKVQMPLEKHPESTHEFEAVAPGEHHGHRRHRHGGGGRSGGRSGGGSGGGGGRSRSRSRGRGRGGSSGGSASGPSGSSGGSSGGG